MKLGGFVIHGNNVDTLPACLESLTSVCDEVVAVDSCSTDGSAQVAGGVRRIVQPWRGYGAARVTAAQALASCDWLLYLDADEAFAPGAAALFDAWRSAVTGEWRAYSVRVRDHVLLGDRGFVYRSHWRKRLLHRDVARWSPGMIVHESVGNIPSRRTDIVVEHRFATSAEVRTQKNEMYALLWAVQAHAARAVPKPVSLQRFTHFLKDALIQGAAIRGGLKGAHLAWSVSAYHARKNAYLRRLLAGEFGDLVELYARGEWEALFAAAAATRRSP